MSSCVPDVAFALCFDGRHIYYTSLKGGSVPTTAAQWQCVDITKALLAKFADFSTAASDIMGMQIRDQDLRAASSSDTMRSARRVDSVCAFQWRLFAVEHRLDEMTHEISELEARDGITFTEKPDDGRRSCAWYTDPACAPPTGNVAELVDEAWLETHAAAWRAAALRSVELIASAAQIQRVHVLPDGSLAAYVSLKRADDAIHENGCLVRLPLVQQAAAAEHEATPSGSTESRQWVDAKASELIHNVSYSSTPHTSQSFANDGMGFVRACLCAPFLDRLDLDALGSLHLGPAERVEGALRLGCGARAYAWQLDPATAACQWLFGPRNWVEGRSDSRHPQFGFLSEPIDPQPWWRHQQVLSRGFLPDRLARTVYNAAQVLHHCGQPQVELAGWICLTATVASGHRLQTALIEEVSSNVSIQMLDLRFTTDSSGRRCEPVLSLSRRGVDLNRLFRSFDMWDHSWLLALNSTLPAGRHRLEAESSYYGGAADGRSGFEFFALCCDEDSEPGAPRAERAKPHWTKMRLLATHATHHESDQPHELHDAQVTIRGLKRPRAAYLQMASGANAVKLFVALDEGIVVAAILTPGMHAQVDDPNHFEWQRTLLCGRVQVAPQPTRTRALVLYQSGCAGHPPGQMVAIRTDRGAGLLLGSCWNRKGEADGVSLLRGSNLRWHSHLAALRRQGAQGLPGRLGAVAAFGVATIREDGPKGGATVGRYVVVGVTTWGEWLTWSMDSEGRPFASKRGCKPQATQQESVHETENKPAYPSVSGRV